MSQREVEIQSRIAERIQGEAKEKIESLEKQLDEIKSKNPPDNIRLLIDRASVTTRDAVSKVDELGKANAAVSAAVAESLYILGGTETLQVIGEGRGR